MKKKIENFFGNFDDVEIRFILFTKGKGKLASKYEM